MPKPPSIEEQWNLIRAAYSVEEVLVALKDYKRKRPKGRPAIPNKHAILNAAAHAKVLRGAYTQIAGRWQLTPKQLIDLVSHNRSYFARRVKQERAALLRKNPSNIA